MTKHWMKQVMFVAVWAISASLFAGNERLTARTDFDLSDYWTIKDIQGNNFCTILSCRYGTCGDYWQGLLIPGVLRPLDTETPFIQQFSQSSIMKKTGMSVEPGFPPNNDMTSMEEYAKGQPFSVNKMLEGQYGTAADAPCRANAPLIVRDWNARPFPFKLAGFGNNYNYDQEEYEKWLAAHPNLLTFDMGEWDNEYINLDYYLKVYLDAKMITPEKAARIAAEFPTPHNPDELYANLCKAFELKKRLYFGDASKMSFMNAGWNLEHIAAYLGAGMVTLETSNSGGGETYYRWQVGMSFARGASRQYSIPWMWYIASCLNGYTSTGEWVSSREPGFDNNNGVGPSWLKRCFYQAYFGGANLMELEHWYLKILAPVSDDLKDFRFSRIGKHFEEFCKYTEENPERGVPYTPVALLVPFLQAYPQWGGNTTGDYTLGTFSIDAFWATIVPSYDRDPALRRGEQGALFNSPYGDIYDVICPDAPEPRNLSEVLKGYKVAILLGDLKSSPEMTAALTEYVEQGGTLVLSTYQLGRYFPEEKAGVKRLHKKLMLKENTTYQLEKIEVTGATVVKKNLKGYPMLTVADCGEGRVVVSTIDGWVPLVQPEYASQTRRGFLTFPYIKNLLDTLVAENLPVAVEGDIQYGINKTPDGYLVYLINNRGVTKMADTAEVVDETAVSKVKVSWKGDSFAQAAELRSGKALAIESNSVSFVVAPGDVSVIRLYNK